MTELTALHAYAMLEDGKGCKSRLVVQVTIDENGSVISARAVSGHPLLQAVSAGAVRQAKFPPTKLSGQPVKVTGVLTYNFVAH